MQGAPFALDVLDDLIANRTALLATFAMPVFVGFSYAFLALDRRREGSPSRDDGQLGLKVLLFSALAVSLLVTAANARDLLAFILGGFKGGWRGFRGPLSGAVAGGGAFAAVYLLLLPRTNHAEKPSAERLAVGMVATWLGGAAIGAVATFLGAVLAGRRWAEISDAMATVGVDGGVAVLMILRLGALSAWQALPRAPAAPMAPPMTGYPPPGAPGAPMPPLGGGYPPAQGGGYPPAQGGGWPQP